VARVQAKLLFVTGTDDEYSSVPQIRRLLEHYQKAAQIVSLRGADHFFSDPTALRIMAEQVALFMVGQLVGEL